VLETFNGYDWRTTPRSTPSSGRTCGLGPDDGRPEGPAVVPIFVEGKVQQWAGDPRQGIGNVMIGKALPGVALKDDGPSVSDGRPTSRGLTVLPRTVEVERDGRWWPGFQSRWLLCDDGRGRMAHRRRAGLGQLLVQEVGRVRYCSVRSSRRTPEGLWQVSRRSRGGRLDVQGPLLTRAVAHHPGGRHSEGTRSALSVEGPPVNRVHSSAPVRRLEMVPARSRGQGGAPCRTNDLDRGEDRHRMLAAEGAEVSAFGRCAAPGPASAPVDGGCQGCGARAPALIWVRAARVGAAAAT
jgi:hypothetical protein